MTSVYPLPIPATRALLRQWVDEGECQHSLGHAGYVGRYRVVHGFADLQHRVAVAIRLFGVGAKNNWRFHRLGSALWSDLGPAAAGPSAVAVHKSNGGYGG
jgi:hypothetical protein